MKMLVFYSLGLMILASIGCEKNDLIDNKILSNEIVSGATGVNKTGKFGKMKDVDGNEYKTIQIGEQIWMAENLKVSKYRNGDDINHFVDNTEWGSTVEGAWCFPNNDQSLYSEYGRLYNWYAVNDPRGLAPKGWHIPSAQEVELLFNSSGGSAIAGLALKDSGYLYWDYSPVAGTVGSNSSGFSARASGWRQYSVFGYWRLQSVFWASDLLENNIEAKAFYINYNEPVAYLGSSWLNSGFSIRCIKD